MIFPGRARPVLTRCTRQWRHASSSTRRPPSTSPSSNNNQRSARPLRVPNEYKPRRPSATTAPPPAPSSPDNDTLLNLWRRSWIPLSGAAVLASLLGFYIFGTAAATIRDSAAPPCSCGVRDHHEHAVPTGRPPAMTGDNAEQFDKELNLPEWWMGITSLRRDMAARATGHVLELAIGSGRNLEYYNWEGLSAAALAATPTTTTTTTTAAAAAAGISRVGGERGRSQPPPPGIASFTGLDISVDMLDVARRKLVRTVPPMKSFATVVRASTMADHTGGQMSFMDDRLRLVNSDAHKPLPPPSDKFFAVGGGGDDDDGGGGALQQQQQQREEKKKENKYYDTIIQTFGLCSVSDPVAVLKNLASAVRPDTGRILLLEHGKSWLGIVNGLLDRNAHRHFDRYGCWWNRDIQELVDEAARATPGLEVVRIERPNISQLGTLVSVELRVRHQQQQQQQRGEQGK